MPKFFLGLPGTSAKIRVGDLEHACFGHPFSAGGDRHRAGVICVMAASGSEIPGGRKAMSDW